MEQLNGLVQQLINILNDNAIVLDRRNHNVSDCVCEWQLYGLSAGKTPGLL